MINSRSLSDLDPVVQPMMQAFVDACTAAGIDLLPTSTYRDAASQAALYAQGRTTPGPIVTDATAGHSFHQYRAAMDVVPLINGKCVWDTSQPVWSQVVQIGKAQGLEWGGDWTLFKEFAHFQYVGGLTIAQLASGAQIEAPIVQTVHDDAA
jgi:peptidoglycan L-alanyl-D-glutamate endopeptidase CwlK